MPSVRDQTIDQTLEALDSLGTIPKSHVEPAFAVIARCTLELGEQMSGLSGALGAASTSLAAKLTELTAEIESTKDQMRKASDSATEQAAALVTWTRVLVGATVAYTLITGGLLLVAIFK